MKTLLVTLGLVGALVLTTPARASADVSVAIGLPGFGLFVGDPYPYPVPAPVYVAPPPVYYAPPVVPVYYPRPVYYGRPYGHYHPGWGYRGHGPWKKAYYRHGR